MRTPQCKHVEGTECSLCWNQKEESKLKSTGSMFDKQESVSKKEEGMDKAAEGNEALLAVAREIAVGIARTKGTVHADDVGKEMARRGLPGLGPAAGHVFRNEQFVWTGEWYESTRVTNHARMLRVWRLK